MTKIFFSADPKKLRERLFEKIKTDLEGGRAEAVVLVVPAQFTLTAEEEAFGALGGEGFLDLHVMSGEKLRSIISAELGFSGKTAVTSVGRQMLIGRILRRRESELSEFRSVAKDGGLAELAADLMVQMRQGDVTAADIEALSEMEGHPPLLSRKLKDAALIAADYMSIMEGKFTDSEDYLKYVTDQVKDSEWAARRIFYYYGFYSFTRSETDFLRELSARALAVNIAFPGDAPGSEDYSASFAAAGRIAAEAPGTVIEICGDAAPPLRADRLVRCSSPFTQAETVAAEIMTLVRDRGFRYSDIAVLTGDMDTFGAPVKRALEACGIPVFSDARRGVMHLPAVALVSGLLSLAAGKAGPDELTELLKTGLLTEPEDEEYVQGLERYMALYHINGDRFFRKFRYGAAALGEGRLAAYEAVRGRIAAKLSGFLESFAAAPSVRLRTEALYRFLADGLSLPERLQNLSESLEKALLFDEAGETAQIWDVMTGIMDQLVELLGDEETDAREYAELFARAFEAVEVGVLPQGSDVVMLGSIGRSKAPGARALFVAGFNDGSIPSDFETDGFFSESEAARLEAEGYSLTKSSTVLAAEERIQILETLREERDFVWLGCCLSDAGGDSLVPSPMLGLFKAEESSDVENSEDPLAMLQGRFYPKLSISSAFRDYLSMASSDIPGEYKAAYNVLLKEGDAGEIAGGFFFDPAGERLGRETASALFRTGGERVLSASQIERFASCPFKYFINYGLRPEELRSFEISGIEIGDLCHEILMRLCGKLEAEKLWDRADEKLIAPMIDSIVEEVSAEKYDGLLTSGKAQAYRTRRIKNLALRFALRIAAERRLSSAVRMEFELPFGKGGALPPVYVELPEGGRARIEGRIDRLDVLSGDYLKIVDYKTGNAEFSMENALKGIRLQLMLYLEGALAGIEGSRPAGVFYYDIKDKTDKAGLDALAGDAADTAFDSVCSISGLAVADKKDEMAYTGKKLVSEEEMETFRGEFRSALRGICERLVSGEIAPAPQKYDSQRDSCTFCDYRPICLYSAARE